MRLSAVGIGAGGIASDLPWSRCLDNHEGDEYTQPGFTGTSAFTFNGQGGHERGGR